MGRAGTATFNMVRLAWIILARTYATLLTDQLATKDDIALLRREIAAQDERFDIKLAALEDGLNARITYSRLATIIILSAVMGAFNIWGWIAPQPTAAT